MIEKKIYILYWIFTFLWAISIILILFFDFKVILSWIFLALIWISAIIHIILTE